MLSHPGPKWDEIGPYSSLEESPDPVDKPVIQENKNPMKKGLAMKLS